MNSLAPLPHIRRSGGFTLVEMIITLMVFVLLSAAIFGIITGVLKSAGSLQDNQNRGDQVMALQAFIQRELGGLPGQSSLVSYRRGDGEGLDQNGIIFGSAGTFHALDAKIQANGLYTLRLANFSGAPGTNALTAFQTDVTTDEPSLVWTKLIPDVQHLSWKFEAINAPTWLDLWDSASLKPNLVEFSIQIAGELQPSVMDFWIPPIFSPLGSGASSTDTETINHTFADAP
jgi:prepilin-type N-terminal cleavage/methylation domain-containing protein